MRQPSQFPAEANEAFLYRLSFDLKKTVRWIKRRMSVRELIWYAAYYAALSRAEARRAQESQQTQSESSASKPPWMR